MSGPKIDLKTCGCCGRPIPEFKDAALQYQWDRGHEEQATR